MAKILCANNYCIYWSDGKCILDEIELNEIGLCASGILVRIEEDELGRKRLKLLEGLRERS